MRITSLTTALAMLLGSASMSMAADTFVLDSSHSQIVFSYDHLGYSRTYGMFSGFEGEILFDEDNPAASSVSISIPVMSMFTGWEARFSHFMSGDFFGAEDGDLITFTSTGIEVTGDTTANITGDLTINDATVPVTLATTLNQASPYPFGPKEGTPTMGFQATTSIMRSDFGLGAFAPAVSDQVDVIISIEAAEAE